MCEKFKYDHACIYIVINEDKDYYVGHSLFGVDEVSVKAEQRLRHIDRHKKNKCTKLMNTLNKKHIFLHLINIPVNTTKELLPGKKIIKMYITQPHIIEDIHKRFFNT